jgi:nucleoside-diphosphate-sugar epimerase
MHKTLILGCGYVGHALRQAWPDVSFTHRSMEQAQAAGAVYFNLEDQDSWVNLPAAETLIWTFPAASINLVKQFQQDVLTRYQHRFVYASSSCYISTIENELVSEQHALDLFQARVVGEEYLREHGATILVLSGIYGPNREPEQWLRNGRIRSLNKRVNLIHCDDIVAITQLLIQQGDSLRSVRINLSDGESLQWVSIAQFYGMNTEEKMLSVTGKRVSNAKLRALLPVDYQFHQLQGVSVVE